MGALTRLILALLLGGCAAMIYFGDRDLAQSNAGAASEGVAQSIQVTRLAPPGEASPLTTLYVSQVNAVLRAGPDATEPALSTLPAGSAAVVIRDIGNGWLHVHAAEIGLQGYVTEGALSTAAPSEG